MHVEWTAVVRKSSSHLMISLIASHSGQSMKAFGDDLRERDARTYARHGWAKELGRLTLHDQPPRSQLIYGMFGSCEPYSWHRSDVLHSVPHCLSSILLYIDSATCFYCTSCRQI